MAQRRIGPVGTVSRVVVGLGLLVLALIQQSRGSLTWGIQLHEALLGLVLFPALMVAVVLAARRSSPGPIRFTGPEGLLLNCAVLTALFVTPYTRGAAALFYGTSLLLAAFRGLPGCEGTVLPNLFFGRDDQIGCPDLLAGRCCRGPPRSSHLRPDQEHSRPAVPTRVYQSGGSPTHEAPASIHLPGPGPPLSQTRAQEPTVLDLPFHIRRRIVSTSRWHRRTHVLLPVTEGDLAHGFRVGRFAWGEGCNVCRGLAEELLDARRSEEQQHPRRVGIHREAVCDSARAVHEGPRADVDLFIAEPKAKLAFKDHEEFVVLAVDMNG
jgi:hypothetical protein